MSGLAHALESWGPTGVFLAAAVDAFVPMPVDALVIFLAGRTGNPLPPTLLATAGSLLGTIGFYFAARAGGERLVARALTPERRARAERRLSENGFLTVFAGAMAPPPFPFKAIVLLAGVLRMPLHLLLAGLVPARLVRYGLEGTLAVFWGDQVVAFMKHRFPLVGLAAVALAAVAWMVSARRRRARDRDAAAAAAATAAGAPPPPAPAAT